MKDDHDKDFQDYGVCKAVEANIFYDVSEQVQREYDQESSIAEMIDDIIMMASDRNDEFQIFQWWTVSPQFAKAATRAGEFVMCGLPFGTIWGRQTCGQPIEQDENVVKVFRSMRLI